jgi:serine-type D-Ala-D-Ala carboxypeptidase (penicillin-binding protein 5/6)
LNPWRNFAALTLALGLISFQGSSVSLAQPAAPSAVGPAAREPALETSASNAVILDFDTGAVLWAKDADTPMPPASMSKLMTMALVFEKLRTGAITLDQTFKVSENAWKKGGAVTDGSTMFLVLGSEVSVRDLLHGVIVQSGNDACIVLAEGISGSEAAFVDEMNARARDLGLATASFRNVTGLPEEGHLVSAADLARLARHIIQTYPDFYPIYSERSFSWNNHTQENRNPLLGTVEGADGLKTGHTNVSGYGLVGSAKRGDERRIIVFNGAKSMAERARIARDLMGAAFSRFRSIRLYAQGDLVGEAEVFGGATKAVALTVAQDVRIAFPRNDRAGLKATIVYSGPIKAPIKAGDQVAKLEVQVPGSGTIEVPLTARADVKRESVFVRIWKGAMQVLGLST